MTDQPRGSAADREANRIAAQTAVAATLTCPCRFDGDRWYYCAGHFHGQHDPSEISTFAAHPANCIGPYEDEAHLQDGDCYCDCPVCTSADGKRCICPDCRGLPECGDHADR